MKPVQVFEKRLTELQGQLKKAQETEQQARNVLQQSEQQGMYLQGAIAECTNAVKELTSNGKPNKPTE